MRDTIMAFVLLAFGAASTADESELTLTVEDKPVPEEIDAQTREKIAEKAYQIADKSGIFFEFWFAKSVAVPRKSYNSQQNALESIETVDLLGALVVHTDDREDFREDVIDPGAYVLRMSHQPQDGNHMGTAPFDTFAILVRADMDEMVLEFPYHEDLVDIALEPTASVHPPILSLQPREENEQPYPHLDVGPEDWQMLCLQLRGETPEGDKVPIDVQLVIEGIGYL